MLDENYITHQLARTLDFRDNQNTQGVGANNEWVYQNDGNHVVVEWPMSIWMCLTVQPLLHTLTQLDGFPVGNLNGFPDN